MTTARLILLSPAYRGQEFELTRNAYTCGRMHDKDISIPDTTVSSYHCDFIRTENGESYILRDNQSTNGTRVNGVPVTNQEVTLAHADIVVIGMVEALFECETARKNVPQSKNSSTTKISLGNTDMEKTIPMLQNFSVQPIQEPAAKHQKWLVLLIALLALAAAGLLVYAVIKLGNTHNQTQSGGARHIETSAETTSL